jgi:hypothetical protein
MPIYLFFDNYLIPVTAIDSVQFTQLSNGNWQFTIYFTNVGAAPNYVSKGMYATELAAYNAYSESFILQLTA